MKFLTNLYQTHQGKVSTKWGIYLREYDRLFLPYRDRPVRTLEIGVQNGGSLEIWSQYFGNGEKFVGCDIDQNCRKLTFDDPRISLIVGDANTDETQAEILSRSDSFDLILDDGSHMAGDIINSFARYFPYLKEGGMFVVEDLHSSYWQEFEGGFYHPYSSIAFFKYLVDIVNQEHWKTGKTRNQILSAFGIRFQAKFSEESLSQIHSIEFLNSICVIKKESDRYNHLGEQVFAGQSDLVVTKDLFSPLSQESNYWSSLESSPAELFEELKNLCMKKAAQLAERDAEIFALVNSLSWKLTIPVRSIERLIRLVVRFFKKQL